MLHVFRQLCVLLNAEDIYKALSKILLQEKNLKFVATMVDVLNTILLTSAELYDLRLQLRNFNKPVSLTILLVWSKNSYGTTVAPCVTPTARKVYFYPS